MIFDDRNSSRVFSHRNNKLEEQMRLFALFSPLMGMEYMWRSDEKKNSCSRNNEKSRKWKRTKVELRISSLTHNIFIFIFRQEIRKGLLKAAKTTGAWVFTGGTNTGTFYSN